MVVPGFARLLCMIEQNKLLINTPNINELGGVANHYLGLKHYWNCRVLYNFIGSKKYRKVMTPFTILKYVWNLLTFRPDMVLLNPSLGNNALHRDFFYLRLARLFHKKVSVFIHGFNLNYAAKADWMWIAKNLNEAEHVIVLAQRFKDILLSKGIKSPISLSTTKVPDSMIKDFDIKARNGKIRNLLFLSRVEKAKGVFEAIQTYSILKIKYPHLNLRIVGDGTALPELQQYVKNNKIEEVTFTGGLRGQAVIEEYKNADFFFFFTSHGEGMPTVVLEAMAFGLPVVTRAVGGLCDFFEDGKMGRITESLNPEDYAKLVEPYLQDKDLVKNTSLYNHRYVLKHFLASKVAENIEDILFSK